MLDPSVEKIPWRRAWKPSILVWRIPWTEEPGRLESMGLQRVRHDWAKNTFTFTYVSMITEIEYIFISLLFIFFFCGIAILLLLLLLDICVYLKLS